MSPTALGAAAERVAAAGEEVRAVAGALGSVGGSWVEHARPGPRTREAAAALLARWAALGTAGADALLAHADALAATARDTAGTDAAVAARGPR